MKTSIDFRFSKLHVSATAEDGSQTHTGIDARPDEIIFDPSILHLVCEKFDTELKELYGNEARIKELEQEILELRSVIRCG